MHYPCTIHAFGMLYPYTIHSFGMLYVSFDRNDGWCLFDLLVISPIGKQGADIALTGI
jgi:hypothetical protein